MGERKRFNPMLCFNFSVSEITGAQRPGKFEEAQNHRPPEQGITVSERHRRR